uniref:Uncharacterized protein n=1 Tax=Rhizophora mucronata TaxID=61149 RepID=A0A2P2LSL1_RHIMU
MKILPRGVNESMIIFATKKVKNRRKKIRKKRNRNIKLTRTRRRKIILILLSKNLDDV